jgi:hypothetical protein
VWPADARRATVGRLEAALEGVLGVAPETPRLAGSVAAPLIGSQTRTFALRYALLPEGSGACR